MAGLPVKWLPLKPACHGESDSTVSDIVGNPGHFPAFHIVLSEDSLLKQGNLLKIRLETTSETIPMFSGSQNSSLS